VSTGAPIILVSHDPRWPALFDREKRRLLTLIQTRVERIEHVVSTSVPGLDSKPIIDIMIGVTRLDDARHCIEPIQSLGYEYVPQ